MARPNLNFDYLIVFLVILFVKNTWQYGDFSDEDYDHLDEDFPSKQFGYAHEDKDNPTKYGKATLTADKIQDYLLSLQSKVLSNNDVLTVKERPQKERPQKEPPKKELQKERPQKERPQKESPQKELSQKERPQKELPQSVLKTDKPGRATVDKLSSDSFVNVQSDQPYNAHWHQNTSPPVAKSNKPSVPTVKPEHTNPPSAYDRFMQDTPNQMQMWNCEFTANHDCGIVNDLSVGKYFHLESKNFFRNFNWKSWYLVLNASTLPKEAVGARLITPYMDTKNASQGCLSMQYLTIASGVARVNLYQQDQGNQCIWNSESKSSSSDAPVNHQLDFTVDLFRGSPRFFLELYLDLSEADAKNTVFALANLRLAYRPCFNDNSNQCKPKPAKNEYEVRMP